MAAPSVSFVGITQSDADGGNWEGASGDTDSEIQGTQCMGAKVSNGTGTMYSFGTSRDFGSGGAEEGDHIYVWLNCVTPNLDVKSNGGLRIVAGNTSEIAHFFVGGDGAEADDPYRGGWRAFVVDPLRTPDVGTIPNISAVNQIGGSFKTISTIMGNFNNCLSDAVRIGTGLRIIDGDVTTPGDFQTLVDTDEGTKANKFGVVRTSGGVVFAQGKLYLGDVGNTSRFEDAGKIVVWDDAAVGVDFYELRIEGTATVILGETAAGVSSNGCLFRAAGSAKPTLTATDGNATLDAYATTFDAFRQLDLHANHSLIDCTIANSGPVAPAGATLTRCLITSSTAVQALEVGAPSDMAAITDCNFTNNDRAIRIGATGTYTFTNIAFSGNTFDVENDSGGAVTIQVNGGDSPTVTNVGGATTTVQQSATLTLTGLIAGSEVRIFDAGTQTELDGVESSGTSFAFTYDVAAVTSVDIVILSLAYLNQRLEGIAVGTTDASLPIQQQPDRTYENP